MGKILDQTDQWPSILLAICGQCCEIRNHWMCQAEIWCSTRGNKLFGSFTNPRSKSEEDTNWLWKIIHKWQVGKLVQRMQYGNSFHHTIFTFAEWYCWMNEPNAHWTFTEFLWEYMVLHAAYLWNRSYTKHLMNTMPYKGWNNKKPNAAHLHEFGALVDDFSWLQLISLWLQLTEWNQLKSKWNQLKSMDSKWDQLNSKWNQLKSQWSQLKSTEVKVKSTEVNWSHSEVNWSQLVHERNGIQYQNFTLPPLFLLDSYWIPIFPVDSLWIPLIPMYSQKSQLSPNTFLF